jgi:hypothetical protein
LSSSFSRKLCKKAKIRAARRSRKGEGQQQQQQQKKQQQQKHLGESRKNSGNFQRQNQIGCAPKTRAYLVNTAAEKPSRNPLPVEPAKQVKSQTHFKTGNSEQESGREKGQDREAATDLQLWDRTV